MAKIYMCKTCGFSSPGPGPLGHHYKDPTNASHRPPYWTDRHPQPNTSHKHLSVVGSKVNNSDKGRGSWQKQAADSREKIQQIRAKIEADLVDALARLDQAQSAVSYLEGLSKRFKEALGEIA